MPQVSNEQIRAARRANLHDYLLRNHPREVRIEGDSLRLADNHSVSIKQGYSGYMDFATGETGNAIECLLNYFDYEFTEAVTALCGDGTARPQPSLPQPPPAPKPFTLPDPSPGFPAQLTAYLAGYRKIPLELVRYFLDAGLAFQEKSHSNIVFVSPEQNYAELRGAVPGVSFHGMVPNSAPTGCFWFKSKGLQSVPDVAYVCEGAIDAMSLYCIHQALAYPPNVLYCSIGGVANQQRIDRIKAQVPTVIAVDNDEAGRACRDRNPDCQTAVPLYKDWNEDWCRYYGAICDTQQNH